MESECSSSSQTRDDARPYRKTNKPLMEKRRRTRINMCLVQLKALVLQATRKDNTQYSKLEKADILELTVKHLRNIHRVQIAGGLTAPDALGRYRAGFSECAQEVLRFLGGAAVPEDVRQRMSCHLASCLASLMEQHLHPRHHYHHVQHLQQLQQQQQQQRGLVSLAQASMLLPHPAFPAPTQSAMGQACLVAGPASLAACSFLALPAQVPLVQEVGPALSCESHVTLVSLAAAPTAFQIPPSATTTVTMTTATSENLIATEALATPTSTEPVQMALVLTSSQAAKHIFAPTTASSVPAPSGDDVFTPDTVLAAEAVSVEIEGCLPSFGSEEVTQEPDLPVGGEPDVSNACFSNVCAVARPHTCVSTSPRTSSPDCKSFNPQSCISTPFRSRSPVSTALQPERTAFKSIRPPSYGCKSKSPRSPVSHFTEAQCSDGGPSRPQPSDCVFPRPHSSDSELPRPHSSDSVLPRPHSSDAGLSRPHSSDAGLPRPHSSDAGLSRPHSSDAGLSRPHSSDAGLSRPHSSDAGLSRPHSFDAGLPRPQWSDGGLPRPHSSDGGIPRPQASDGRPGRTLSPVSSFTSSSSETPDSSSRPGFSPPLSPCTAAAEEKMWRPW